MNEYDTVKRKDLYDRVWKRISDIAYEAAPGSITPETFAHVSVDIVLMELLQAGAILPDFLKQ